MASSGPQRTPGVLVEWNPVLDAWLTPALLSLQHSAMTCVQPDGTSDVLLRLIVQHSSLGDASASTDHLWLTQESSSISYFREKTLVRSNHHGITAIAAAPTASQVHDERSGSGKLQQDSKRSVMSSNSNSAGDGFARLVLVATRQVQCASIQPALSFSCGRWLTAQRHRIGLLMSCLMLTLVLLFIFQPGRQEVHIIHEGKAIPIYLSHSWTMLSFVFLVVVMCFFWLHLTSIEIFKKFTIRSFDAWMIVLNHFIMDASQRFETISLAPAGTYDSLRLISEPALFVALNVGIAFFGHIDAAIISRKWKISLVILVLVIFSYNYIVAVYQREWSSIGFCFAGQCMTARECHVAGTLNMVIYFSKLLFKYMSGDKFATLSVSYTECDFDVEQILTRPVSQNDRNNTLVTPASSQVCADIAKQSNRDLAGAFPDLQTEVARERIGLELGGASIASTLPIGMKLNL